YSRRLRDWMMGGDGRADHDDDNSRRRGKSPPTEPAAHPIKASGLLANAPHHIPGEEWGQRRLGNAAENIPQLFVIFTIHSLPGIAMFSWVEVSLEWQP